MFAFLSDMFVTPAFADTSGLLIRGDSSGVYSAAVTLPSIPTLAGWGTVFIITLIIGSGIYFLKKRRFT